MTEKRYLDESAVTTVDATVEAAGPDGVALGRTHCCPTGGGRPRDTGVLRDETRPEYASST